MSWERERYEWLDEEERNEFDRLLSYFMFIADALNIFSTRHSWLLKSSIPRNEGNFISDLYQLYLINAKFYLGQKSREDWEPLYKYNRNIIYPQEEALKKIAEEQGLNSEQAKELKELAYKQARFLDSCLMGKLKLKDDLLRGGPAYKAFWMEENFNNFIKIMKEEKEEHIKKSWLIDKIPEAFMKGDGAKKYEGDEGKKRFTKDITDEVFAEFEKDLRDVQQDVMTHWWERKDVEYLAKGAATLSVFASTIAIVEGVRHIQWVKWFVSIVGGGLAVGYCVYKIYKWIKNRRP